MTLGQRLRQARLQKGLTQAEVAQHLGVTQHSVSAYESDRIQLSAEKLTKMAQLLDVSVDYLLGMDDHESEVEAPPSVGLAALNWAMIGTKLGQLRHQRGISLEQAAELVTTSVSEWQRWESGRWPISLDILSRIAKAFGVSLSYFLVDSSAKSSSRTATGGLDLDQPLSAFLPVRTIPILGRIVAGIPVEAQPDPLGSTYVDKNSAANFALQVYGDSMIGAGIHPGDVVVVRSVATWEEVPDGAMIVALVQGETTLKYLIRESDPLGEDRWWLRAANPAYPDRPMDPSQDLVQGIVIALHTPHALLALDSIKNLSPTESPGNLVNLLSDLTDGQQETVRMMVNQFRQANAAVRSTSQHSTSQGDQE
ncbi:MAG: helix-turn-helix domain-containing protein [Firmicutes bacterium]|nr:helix-turn-helix domain-containing protein [Bacillota bacterium]